MNKQDRVIAIDIDEVTADFISYFVYFHNLMYKTNFTIDQMSHYHLHKAFDVELDEMRIRFAEFSALHLLERLTPVEGAVNGIKKLVKTGYEVHFVTARPQIIEKETRVWFKKNIKVQDFPIHFTHAESGKPKRKKSEICEEIGATIMIDDHIGNAVDCAEKGITVYLMEAPWNINVTDLPEGIIRVKSWEEILQKILK